MENYLHRNQPQDSHAWRPLYSTPELGLPRTDFTLITNFPPSLVLSAFVSLKNLPMWAVRLRII